MRPGFPDVWPTEDAAAAAPAGIGIAALFTAHVLRDGEIVLRALKPSLWFIPLQSLLFMAVVWFIAIVATLANGRIEYGDRLYAEIALLLTIGRLAWAVLQWMGRLYILTDQRILRLAGVFSTDIFDCPLRKVAAVRPIPSTFERFVGVGSIEIVPCDPRRPRATWQTVARPRETLAEILAAINRTK